VIVRRIRATLRVSRTAGGSTTRDSSDSRQLSAAMATAVPMTVVALAAAEVAVEVTTDCMPPTSFISRDCTSPPLVRVKKPSDWRCRWLKTAVRRPCMTCCPTVVDSQVCTTPSTAVTAETASMPATASSNSETSGRGSASSMTRRIRNGVARAIVDDATISRTTRPSCHRYGRNSAATRLQRTGERSSCARSAGSVRRPERPPPPPVDPLASSIRPPISRADAEATSRCGNRRGVGTVPGMADDAATLGDLLMRVARTQRRRWHAALAPWGLSPHQVRALRVVCSRDGVRLSDLAGALRIAPRSATEVADALQEAGLVERATDPADRRAVVLRATEAGRRVQEEVAAARAADSAELFARLGPADRAELGRLLRVLAD
jgi:DNA-binding MarR family transcriptional regulator